MHHSTPTMIMTQTPMRITLGGGGTDVVWYSRQRGGAWISAAINAYVYVIIHQGKPDISNPLIRACLSMAKVKEVEVVTFSDIEGKSGLGGSGAFEVGLLNALSVYNGKRTSKRKLAKEASDIEIKHLHYPVGPQDQYSTSLGGIHSFEINKRGRVIVEPLALSKKTVAILERNLLFFKTGIDHTSADILTSEKISKESIDTLDQIKDLGQHVKYALLQGNMDEFGKSLHTHWQIKKRLSKKVSTVKIDAWYDEAIKAGALGGKIMGAGGGGWFMFYVNRNKKSFINRMKTLGLTERPMRFDWQGTRVIFKQ